VTVHGVMIRTVSDKVNRSIPWPWDAVIRALAKRKRPSGFPKGF
jgi:hypothetical protein